VENPAVGWATLQRNDVHVTLVTHNAAKNQVNGNVTALEYLKVIKLIVEQYT
jgi:hypothetical protein